MSTSDCDCCNCVLENGDILIMLLKCFVGKKDKMNKSFLVRCYIGLLFDLTEYGILKGTASQINDDGFTAIFVFYGMFTALVTFLHLKKEKKDVYMFFYVWFFKCISLSVAICIFTTSSDFEWKTIETHFANIDSAKNFFLAFVVLVSFVDICLSITVLVLQFLKIICVMQHGHGFDELLTQRFDLFGDEDSPQSREPNIQCSQESGSMFPKLKVTESDPYSY